ncbi:MAG: NAD-dependent epimerase/dehydratase family protein, partial [Acidimicrobiia bacterium]
MPRAVVTGGAGFIGSHLCRALRGRDWEVVAVDNLSTGRRAHVTEHDGDPGFRLLEHDVTVPFDVAGPVDAVLH